MARPDCCLLRRRRWAQAASGQGSESRSTRSSCPTRLPSLYWRDLLTAVLSQRRPPRSTTSTRSPPLRTQQQTTSRGSAIWISYGRPSPWSLTARMGALGLSWRAIAFRAGPIRLNSEPGPISGFSAVRKRRTGHGAGLCTAGRFGRLRRTGNRPAVHNPCGVPRSSLKPLSSSPTDWRSRTRPVSFDQGSSAAGVCCRTR